MKETKVYVDELPESCSKCEWCTLNHKNNYGIPFCLMARMPLYNGDKANEERGQHKDSLSDFDCPLIDIKTHDRELVKEVCEKIKDRAYENTGYHICECGKKFDIECIDFEDLCEVVAQIQKEFEDERF